MDSADAGCGGQHASVLDACSGIPASACWAAPPSASSLANIQSPTSCSCSATQYVTATEYRVFAHKSGLSVSRSVAGEQSTVPALLSHIVHVSLTACLNRAQAVWPGVLSGLTLCDEAVPVCLLVSCPATDDFVWSWQCLIVRCTVQVCRCKVQP